jgi:hypothetical protein
MWYWFLLATAWHRDGTAFRERKLVNALANGDPWAIAYVGVVVLIVAGPALYRWLHKR